MRRLRHVSLKQCKKLKALPESFGLLPQIEYLDMTHCTNVKIEEGSFGSISTLKEVYLLNCRRLETFPTQLTRQRSLKKLGIATVDEDSGRIAGFGHNAIFIDIPENIGDLSKLTELRLGNLTGLPQSIGSLSQLVSFHLWGLAIPDTIGLKNLRLLECPQLEGLQTCIGKLSCSSWLQELPTSIGNLSGLSELHLSNCLRLHELPTSIGNLCCLKYLYLLDCPRLQELPTSIGNLSCLSELRLWNCPRLQELPTSIGNLSCLSRLDLSDCPRLQELPTSIGNLSCLSRLDLRNCPRLQELPTSIGNLSCLSELRLRNCPRLQELPTSIGNLSCLSCLQLLDLPLTDSFLTEENSVLLENLISPSLEFKFTASAIPYPTAWLDSYHFQMMSKPDTIPFVSGSSGMKCSLPAATTKECTAIIICFISVLQLNDNQLAAPPLAQCRFQWCSGENEWDHDTSLSKLGDTIHLKILYAKNCYQYIYQQSGLRVKSGLNISMDELSSSVKGYFKYGWFKIIRKGEENLIQKICGDFFRELRRQRPLAVARASTPSLLDLGNVHALHQLHNSTNSLPL
eukprot:Gb_04285 [translate_table: standard]